MTLPIALYLVAVILALIDEFQAKGQSLVAWAVVLICVGLLWGHVG